MHRSFYENFLSLHLIPGEYYWQQYGNVLPMTFLGFFFLCNLVFSSGIFRWTPIQEFHECGCKSSFFMWCKPLSGASELISRSSTFCVKEGRLISFLSVYLLKFHFYVHTQKMFSEPLAVTTNKIVPASGISS